MKLIAIVALLTVVFATLWGGYTAVRSVRASLAARIVRVEK